VRLPIASRSFTTAMDPNLRFRTDRRLTLRVAAIACLVSCCLVVLDLWDSRNLFDPEGITFLDMADAYRRGDWRAALIGLWSPLYPWLLALMMIFFNPSAQWEFTAVHALNFFIYLVALASFSVFMREFLRANKDTAANGRLPDWSWLVLGYSLFTWSTIRLMPLHLPEPDSIVCALVYLIFAMLYRIRMGAVTWGESIFLGVLLGLGYLSKAVMFPMAFVFGGVALILAGRSAKKLSKILVAFSVFLLLSLPYIVVLSDANERWMFSDAGRLNYVYRVNQVNLIHWQGEESVHGAPIHPTRKIYDNPPMYEFGTPFKVTYPPWYDPSYWNEGVKMTADLQRQLSLIIGNTKALLMFLADSPGPAVPNQPAYYYLGDIVGKTIGTLLTLFCVMILTNLGRVSVFRRISEHWFVLVPIGAVLGAYSLLNYEGRYIAAYVVVLWMVLFQSVAIPYSEESKRIFTAILTSAALITVIILAAGTGRAVLHAARYFMNGNTEAPFLQSGYTDWKVAKYLHNAGLRAGEPVGAVGWTLNAYWARMARVHIVAEVPHKGARAFWSSDTAKRAVLMQLFQDVGAKAVVGKGVPVGSAPVNWQHIGDTDYYVYVFQNSDE
jgi:4-amino-4-deoxy-L-arabinose transferase-like glycosyltransferase